MTKTTSTKGAPAAKKATVTKSKKSPTKRGGGGGGAQKVLDWALFYEARQNGDPNVARKVILSVSGVKPSTFTVLLSTMKTKGLIEYDKEFIRLTEAGRSRADASGAENGNTAMDNDSAQADIKEKHKLGNGKPGLLFDALVDGRVYNRVAIMAQIGCDNKGTFAVMISNLKKKGIITYDKTTIQLADMCFPFGRPAVE